MEWVQSTAEISHIFSYRKNDKARNFSNVYAIWNAEHDQTKEMDNNQMYKFFCDLVAVLFLFLSIRIYAFIKMKSVSLRKKHNNTEGVQSLCNSLEAKKIAFVLVYFAVAIVFSAHTRSRKHGIQHNINSIVKYLTCIFACCVLCAYTPFTRACLHFMFLFPSVCIKCSYRV